MINRNLFTGTKEFGCEIILLKNGYECKKLRTFLDVKPLSEKTFPIPGELLPDEDRDASDFDRFITGSDPDNSGITCECGNEYSLIIKFKLNNSELFAERGYEICYGQSLPGTLSFSSKEKSGKDIKAGNSDISETGLLLSDPTPYRVSHGKGNLGIRGNDFEIQFSGPGLTSYKKCGRELIEGIPAPAFWRAPIDNDRGNRMALRCSQWKLADMYAYVSRFDVSEENGRVLVIYTYSFPTHPVETCTIGYLVDFDGRIDITVSSLAGKKLGSMPVFGMRFKFDADFDRIRWYGYGPGESYSDRSHGNPLGIHTGRVADQLSRYLVPQECGNKIGVRNAGIIDAKGRGILFTALPDVKGSGRYVDKALSKELAGTFEFQALPYSAHELENAMHTNELPPANYTHVRIALAQLGVGGDDSWGAPTHEEYHIDVKKPLSFRFSMKAI